MISLLLLLISGLNAADSIHKSVFVPEKFGQVNVLHNGKEFFVKHHDKIHAVNHYDVDKSIRNLSTEKLQGFLKAGGYLMVKRLDNDYAIVAKVRGDGGGPIFGYITYVTVKVSAYAGAIIVGGAAAATAATVGGPASVAGGVLVANQLAGATASAPAFVAAVESAAYTAGWAVACCPWVP